jgi:LysR family nitrogen assimilation transcriptional regulator
MDLRQIECFLCLYQEGNVTRAAARLGIVQPALSTQIAKLEKDLQVQLFDRTSRGMTPTAAGTDLHKMLLPLSLEVAGIRQRMHDLGGQASGIVRLGVVPSLGVSIVPRTLSAYCEQHADVLVRLTEAYSSGLVDRLEAGVLDLAVVNHSQRLGGLATEDLVSEELVLVVAKDSPLAPPGHIGLDGIAGERLIVPTAGQGLRVIIDSSLGRRGLCARPRLEMDALTPTLELVKTGNWATILPISAIAHELEARTLRICRIDEEMRRELVVVHHPRRPLSLAARSLVERLACDTRRAIDLAEDVLNSVAAMPSRRKVSRERRPQ